MAMTVTSAVPKMVPMAVMARARIWTGRCRKAEAPLWEWFEARVVDWLRSYGYQQLRTPLLEHTELFVRGIGEVTDIVEKEMYSFEDRLNGEHLTLRPEATAGVVRAVAEHSMLYDGGKRLYYMGPMFRHERPQRGRYRQFHQIGAEALGFAGAEVDAELILLAQALWRELGLKNVRLELNSLGQPDERKAHRAALTVSGELADQRRAQQRDWLWAMIDDGLKRHLLARPEVARLLAEIEAAVLAARLTPTEGARRVLALIDRDGRGASAAHRSSRA